MDEKNFDVEEIIQEDWDEAIKFDEELNTKVEILPTITLMGMQWKGTLCGTIRLYVSENNLMILSPNYFNPTTNVFDELNRLEITKNFWYIYEFSEEGILNSETNEFNIPIRGWTLSDGTV